MALLLVQQIASGPPEPAVVLNAEQQWAGADVLLPLANSQDTATARYAIRALGRLEHPALIPNLLALTARPGVAPAAADAIAQTLQGFDPARDQATIAAVGAPLRHLAGHGAIRW